MVAAMMLPTSLPLIRLFEAATGKQERAWRTQGAFLAGYAALWTGFGALAFLGDVAVRRAIDAVPRLAERPSLVTGITFALAGAFQFSRLKHRCLIRCCHPTLCLRARYRRGAAAAGFRHGCRHGIVCLGCCWALMLLMFAPVAATFWWMAALTALMVYERVGRHGARAARAAGVVLLGTAVLQLARPAALPAALGGSAPFAARTQIGPGPVKHLLRTGRYRLELRISPNRTAATGTMLVELRNRGRAVNGARIRTRFTMLDMDMGEVSTRLRQTGPGTYAATTPPLPMSGRWRLHFEIAPIRADPFTLDLVDELAT
jgi:hypothetical protein